MRVEGEEAGRRPVLVVSDDIINGQPNGFPHSQVRILQIFRGPTEPMFM